jgi:hypothetical protein
MNQFVEIKNPDDGIWKNVKWWIDQGVPNTAGIYIYVRTSGEVVYVGKTKKLAHRLSHHFTRDHKDELVEGSGVFTWTYQNEFPNQGTRVFYSLSTPENIDVLEASLIQAHVLKHRARPVHNGTIPKKGELSADDIYQATNMIEYLSKIVARLNS